jgi:hypothetical protein
VNFCPEFRQQIVKAGECVRQFTPVNVHVVAFATLVVVTDCPDAILSEIETVLEYMAASRNRCWNSPINDLGDVTAREDLFGLLKLFSTHVDNDAITGTSFQRWQQVSAVAASPILR